MSGHESNTWGRGLSAGTPAVEAVSHVAVHVQEDTKSDVLIDFTDSHVVDFEGLTLLLTAQRLAHSEDRQVWLMGPCLRRWAWTFSSFVSVPVGDSRTRTASASLSMPLAVRGEGHFFPISGPKCRKRVPD